MTPREALAAMGCGVEVTPLCAPGTLAPDGRVEVTVRTPWGTRHRVVAAEDADAALADAARFVALALDADAAAARETVAGMVGSANYR